MNPRKIPVPFAILIAGALIPLFTLLTPGANGQSSPEPRTLSGNVYYAGGDQPAENVSVELRSTEGSMIAPLTTSSTGWFEFRGLRPMPYTIAINVAEFQPVNFNVDLTFSSSRGLVIYLNPRAERSGPSHSAATVSAHELSMPSKARDSMASGRKKLYTDKDAQGALADFQEAVALAPGYYEACYQIAMAYLTLGARDNAEKYMRQSIAVSGDQYGEADIGLGTMMLDKNDFPAGEKMIRHGLELSPGSWLGYYELGRALLNENRIDDAEKAGEQARFLAPNVPIVYRLLSNLHLRKQNYPALLEDLNAYLKLDPDSPAAVRAKQIRNEVQQKIADDKSKSPADSKP